VPGCRTALALVVAALAGVAASAAGEPRARAGTLDDIRRRGELTWGGDIQGGEPYVYEDPQQPGRLIGFEVEIAEGIARRLGGTAGPLRARFVQIAWSSLVPGLERGDFDVALNGLEATDERRARIRLSRPYYVYAETLAVRRGAPWRYLDLGGKRVGTLTNTYAFDILRRQGIEPVPYEGVQEPYLDLAQGRIDAVLLDDVIANRYGCTMPALECVPGEAALGAYVVGMRRADRDLAAAVDAALDDMARTGELRQILERWKLWNQRQEARTGLPGATAAGASASAGPPAARRSFDVNQLELFLAGAAVTLGLSALAFALAMVLGALLAVARRYGGPVLSFWAAAYVEVFRGTPVLLQLYVLYFALAPVLRLDAFQAAVLGLGLNYAAYEAEIYRGALAAIPRGQSEAAHALGMSSGQTLRDILLPQALRVALPAMTNDFVALLKDSSVVSVITVVELTKRMTIAGVDLNDWIVPGLACGALYFLMSFPLAHLARLLERRLARDPHPRPL
jgi:polar amino acid transport system permease protein/polar amino acid transport system substrate-binding protein